MRKRWLFMLAAFLFLAACSGGEVAESEDVDRGEEIYSHSCASCHGQELSGGVGPELIGVGDRLTEDEIKSIIENGIGTMPAILPEGEDSKLLAEWLSEG